MSSDETDNNILSDSGDARCPICGFNVELDDLLLCTWRGRVGGCDIADAFILRDLHISAIRLEAARS